MFIKILKWLIKYGTPPYLIFFIVIVISDIEKNLNYETIMKFMFGAPIGILFLSPIGKFYHHCFHETKDFNKETINLVKGISDNAKNINNNQDGVENKKNENPNSKFKEKKM